MGKVIITIRVMPESVETNLDELALKVKNEIKLLVEGEPGIKKVPIAFGLSSLEVTCVMTEAEGGTDPVEKKISEIKGVIGVDVINVSLI